MDRRQAFLTKIRNRARADVDLCEQVERRAAQLRVSVEEQRLHQRRVERQLLLEEERIRAEGEQLQRERAVLAAADVELSSYRHRQTERGMFTRCALSCLFVMVTLCLRVDVQCYDIIR